MRGSIIRRGKSYSVVVDLGRDPETGRRRQKWHSGYRTKREAEVALADLVGSVDRGTYVAPSKQSFAEFAADWLEAIKPTLRDSTHYSYTRNLRLHVIPHLGALHTTAVDAGVLNGLYARLLASGNMTNRPGAAPGLSPRTVRYIHTIVHRMFKDAVRWGRLVRNPADAADPPRAAAAGSPEIVTWSAEQLGAFLDGMREHRLYAVFLLLATTGMRRGEALGLRWSDLDLASGRLAVRQTVIAVHHKVEFGTPKTAKGRRTVMLDVATVAALREHRKRQAAERLNIGAGWTDLDLVFAAPDGAPLHPERFSRTFTEHVARLGLPAVPLHALRHGWATLALAAGVHPKVVQERLGHATISITLDIYSHVTTGLHSDAAEQVAGLVFGGR